MLVTLAGIGSGTFLEACNRTPKQSVTSEEIRVMAKAMTGADVSQQEADKLSSSLHDLRFVRQSFKPGEVDPTIQPVAMFDPEVDLG
jgi:hypothetical protein